MSLVTTKEMLSKAYKGGYAVGAFNISNMETIQAITEACAEEKSPVILQVSAGARKYAKGVYLKKLCEAAVLDTGIDLALHLDHGGAGLSKEDAFLQVKSCVDDGFTSVMIDGSHYPLAENIELTKRVTDYAHSKGVTVEAELGRLSGIEDDVNVSADHALFTDPDETLEFVTKTNVDSLAIAIGTSHGAFKFKGEANLRFDILEEIQKRLDGFPIVLHGASSVIPEYVDIINKYGGKMDNAKGIPEDMLRKAASMAVCKINIDSDIRLAITGAIRKMFAEEPGVFDPRTYLTVARDETKKLVKHKIINVLGSQGKA